MGLRAAVGLSAAVLLACGGGGSTPEPSPAAPVCTLGAPVPVDGPAWTGFGGNAQHTAIAGAATLDLGCIAWQAPVDVAPQLSPSGALLAHYGSPLITRADTVLMPVKTGASGSDIRFRVEARSGHDGTLKWTLDSDYVLPAHRWVPSFNPVLAAGNTPGAPMRVLMPASGGRLIVRHDPDAAVAASDRQVFYGQAAYDAAPAAFDASVFIATPLVADTRGHVYFGFSVTSPNPLGLVGGFARVAPDGSAVWISAAAASGDAALVKPQTNSAPALSADERTLYVVVNNVVASPARPRGSLLALDADTLTPIALRPLLDPATGTDAWVSDDSTASPTIGPDGDVYLGVLESAAANHHFRGWLLHFDATLGQTRTPGSFGWDDTASVVPRAMVPQYTGASSYLLLTKYNNYGGNAGGDGRNRVAILDPQATQPDPINPAVTVMREVITQLGPTADPEVPPYGVKEWCINTAAVDPATASVLINSEDGMLYRWHLPSNRFTQRIALNAGRLQSYTPTVVSPSGRVYAVNNAQLHSIGR